MKQLIARWLHYRVKFLALAPVLMVSVAAGVVSADDVDRSLINCFIQEGPCTRKHNGTVVHLDIQPRPVKAMEDLTFTVSVDPREALDGPPVIRLNMLAMDMGENLVRLKMAAPGVYEGRGVIVRCRSGLRTWKATVILPEMGSVDFIFDVIY